MENKSIQRQIIQLLNIFSVDVVVGSIMMGLYATRILRVQDPLWWYLVLALSVWVMYTADHLLDAVQGKEDTTIERHAIHYKYRKRIIPVWIGAALAAGAIAIYKLDDEIIYAGLILGLLVCIYFILLYYNRKRRPWLLQKELFIALVYVGGIWLAPLVWHATRPSSVVLLIIINMVLLAWAEGIVVSWYERQEDLLNSHTSFTTLFGRKAAKIFVLIILAFVVLTAGYHSLFSSFEITLQAAGGIQLIMAFMLAALLFFPDRFRQNQLYRYLGELSFWLPGLILLA